MFRLRHFRLVQLLPKPFGTAGMESTSNKDGIPPGINSYSTQHTDQEQYDVAASDFIGRLHELIQKNKILRGANRDGKVLDFKIPQELEKLMSVDIGHEGKCNTELLELCAEVIQYSAATGNVMFFNQLYGLADPYGVAGAWLTESLNTNEHTFEVAPAFIIINNYILKRLTGIVGYDNGDGIFTPGGSMANIMGVALARYKQNPDIKTKGLYGCKRLVMFASEMCHYSYSKASAFLGMGTESLISVKTDHRGKMCMTDLKQKIEEQKRQGAEPLAVLATSGTTVLGAFDDLEGIADICETYKLWMHVDDKTKKEVRNPLPGRYQIAYAPRKELRRGISKSEQACWGGGVLFSPSKRHLMKGVERSDSMCISLHKMMSAPLQCVPLLTREKGILQKCFSYGATYLFQQDKAYDVSYDLGDKTVQCGRKPDALKFWLMWQAKGDAGMAAHVDKAFDNADYFKRKLEQTEGFRLVLNQYECTNVGFWYVPKRMRGKEETEEWWEELSKIAPKIKEGMQVSGSMLIGYQPLANKGFVNFFRIIIENPRLTPKDLDHVVQEIDRLGRDL